VREYGGMTTIAFEDGKPVFRDGKVGIQQECCCGPLCSGACDEENPCPEGCECVEGQCQPEPECPRIEAGNGWYTANHKEDFTNFLLDLGYTNPIFTPSSPFPGVPAPFTDGCGSTYYYVTYECCGTFDFSNPCDPAFVVRNLRDAAGAGNQNPPCFFANNDVFLWVCCTEEPPP
jgi:hypothetical protein